MRIIDIKKTVKAKRAAKKFLNGELNFETALKEAGLSKVMCFSLLKRNNELEMVARIKKLEREEKRKKREKKIVKFNPKATDKENFDYGKFFTVNEMWNYKYNSQK